MPARSTSTASRSTPEPPLQAGNITLTAKTITIDNGAQLLANATTAHGKSGTIIIQAVDNNAQVTGVPLAENADVNLLNVGITIGNATIVGGNVEILATASCRE